MFYMPANANLALRELDITLFMAAVGLGAGAHFAAHPLTLESAGWVATGAVVTMLPLFVVSSPGSSAAWTTCASAARSRGA